MSADAWIALSPAASLTVALLAVALVGAFFPRHTGVWLITLAGHVAAFVSLAAVAARAPLRDAMLLRYDSSALYFTALILAASFAITLVSRPYLARRTVHGEGHHREYYLLLLLALTGSVVLVACRHFATLFLGLELLSVSLIGLVAYQAGRPQALEAGIKYLLLSGSSSAFLLFGLALEYAATGSLALDAGVAEAQYPLARTGMLLALVGFGFKLSLVPFHMWAPDVYEGAPAPVTAFLAAVSKGAVAAVLWRWLSLSPMGDDAYLLWTVTMLAVVSMVAGNLLALFQENLKRLLAYSSIGHMGFLLVPIVVAGPVGAEATGFYLAAYISATLAAFLTVAHLSYGAGEAAELITYRGLFWNHPLAAGVLGVALLSLAGIPLTVGFFAKFYLFAAGVEGAKWGLVTAVAVASAMGIYYYLRVITLLFASESRPLLVAQGSTGVLWLLALFIMACGVVPAPLIDAVRAALH